MSEYEPTQEEIDAGALALFLTVNAHQAAVDAVGIEWHAIKAATRQPWEKAARKVIIAARLARPVGSDDE